MLFVTGTGTDIGKTFVTALLLRQLREKGIAARAIKPVLSGFDTAQPEASDAGVLIDAMGEAVTPAALDQIAPWRFRAPLSPDMAAAREGRLIDFAALIDFCRAVQSDGPLLIEGVGGTMVPIDDRHTVLDWMKALDAPVLLIGGTYLGAISDCLTSVTAIRTAGLSIRAIILNQSVQEPVSAEETAASIGRFTAVPIHIVPRAEWGNPMPDLTDLAF